MFAPGPEEEPDGPHGDLLLSEGKAHMVVAKEDGACATGYSVDDWRFTSACTLGHLTLGRDSHLFRIKAATLAEPLYLNHNLKTDNSNDLAQPLPKLTSRVIKAGTASERTYLTEASST